MGGPRLRPPCSSTIEWGLVTFTAVLRAVLQKHVPLPHILLAKSLGCLVPRIWREGLWGQLQCGKLMEEPQASPGVSCVDSA